MTKPDVATTVTPDGYHTVAPWIVTRDTGKEIDFLVAAFRAVELGRVLDADGSIGHAEVRIGDFIVLLFDAKESWPDTPSMLRLFVADIDSVFARSLAAGATAVTNPWTAAWGDRVARVSDPLGNIWWLMEHVENVDLDEMQRRLAQPAYVDAMRYAQTSLDRELSARGQRGV